MIAMANRHTENDSEDEDEDQDVAGTLRARGANLRLKDNEGQSVLDYCGSDLDKTMVRHWMAY